MFVLMFPVLFCCFALLFFPVSEILVLRSFEVCSTVCLKGLSEFVCLLFVLGI